jgi:hypothetical protein
LRFIYIVKHSAYELEWYRYMPGRGAAGSRIWKGLLSLIAYDHHSNDCRYFS